MALEEEQSGFWNFITFKLNSFVKNVHPVTIKMLFKFLKKDYMGMPPLCFIKFLKPLSQVLANGCIRGDAVLKK